MSRIGKQNIVIPSGTTVTVSNDSVVVKGPKGELSLSVRPDVGIAVSDGGVTLEPKKKTDFAKALWGTYASHISNMITGVNEPFVKKLVIEGVGFRASLEGKKLVMQLGFSHPVEMGIPDDLSLEVEKDVITVSGIDKERVGLFASQVRAKKKPEPYKGKGIRYDGEVVRRKQGKKAIGTT